MPKLMKNIGFTENLEITIEQKEHIERANWDEVKARQQQYMTRIGNLPQRSSANYVALLTRTVWGTWRASFVSQVEALPLRSQEPQQTPGIKQHIQDEIVTGSKRLNSNSGWK